MKTVLCVVAGASGGHIIPGIQLLKKLAQKYEEPELLFISTTSTFDKKLIEELASSFSYCSLPILPVPGKKLWRYPLFFLRMMQSWWISYRVLSKMRPEKLVSMGGVVSIPVCLAGWIVGCKITLVELNAIPGRAVSWLAPFATSVKVCFKEAEHYFDPAKVTDIPYPLQFSSKDCRSKQDACRHLGLDPLKKILLVLGGSHGSLSMNNVVRELSKAEADRLGGCIVVHQAGAYMIDGVPIVQNLTDFYKKQGIDARVFSFTNDMSWYYCAADLILARAGAGTLNEIEFFNKRAVLVPLEMAAGGHQLDNAVVMIDRRPDLFSLVRQDTGRGSSKHLNDHLIQLLTQPEELR